eukprot:GHVU01134326.1.p2 GENE.GHVU01134326.1~~GHVU01134326.1.p2  ORF type:complete len:161 (+),score=17.50 GHVU01134326.1:298-780(+)
MIHKEKIRDIMWFDVKYSEDRKKGKVSANMQKWRAEQKANGIIPILRSYVKSKEDGMFATLERYEDVLTESDRQHVIDAMHDTDEGFLRMACFALVCKHANDRKVTLGDLQNPYFWIWNRDDTEQRAEMCIWFRYQTGTRREGWTHRWCLPACQPIYIPA